MPPSSRAFLLAAALGACASPLDGPIADDEPVGAIELALAGDLDTGFGPGGVVVTPVDVSASAYGQAVRRQPDGKLVVAAEAWTGARHVGLVGRFNADGRVDTTFADGRGWTTLDFSSSGQDVSFFDLALQGDGKIVAAGRLSNASGSAATAIVARWNADGTRDLAFGSNGYHALDVPAYRFSASAVAVQGDGRIVAAGWRESGGALDAFVMRLTAAGALDPDFQATGWRVVNFNTNEEATGLAIQVDGKIVIGGTSSGTHTGGTYSDMFVARLSSSGLMDGTFSGDGIALAVINDKDTAAGLTLQADGKIVLVGQTYSGTASTYDVALARFTSTGALDATFSGDGKHVVAAEAAADGARAVVQTTGGQLLLAGHAVRPGGRTDVLFVRLTASGALDTTFDADGIRFASFGTGAAAYDLVLQPDGRGVAVGNRSDGVDARVALLRVNASGALDAGFDGDGRATLPLGEADKSFAAAVQPDGKLLLAGYTHTGFFQQCLVVRFTTTGALDTTFSGDGKAVFAFTGGGDCRLKNIALQGDGRILVSDGPRVARLTTAGALDSTFDSDGRVVLNVGEGTGGRGDLAVLADGKILVGGSIRQLGIDRLGLARLNPNGSLDTTYSGDGWTTAYFSGANHRIERIAPLADGRVLALGDADDLGPLVMRFTAAGSIDGTFGVGGRTLLDMGAFSESPAALLLLPDGRIAAATNAVSTLTTARIVVWRLNAGGSLDTSFDGDGRRVLQPLPLSGVAALARQSDGKLVVVGRALDVTTGQGGCLVARVNVSGALDGGYGGGDGWVTVQPGFACGGTGAAFAPGSNALYVGGHDNFEPPDGGGGLERGDDTPWDVVAFKLQP